MGPRTFLAAALSVVATALVIVEALQWSGSARFAPFVENAGKCAQRIVTIDAPNSTSGLLPGDVLPLERMSVETRSTVVFHYARVHPAPRAMTIALPIERDGKALTVPYRFGRDDGAPVFLMQLAFKLVILAIGLFVLWRGRDAAATYLGVWCTGIAVALPDAWWGTLPFVPRAIGVILTNTIWTILPYGLYLVVESIVTGARAYVVWIARIAMLLSLLPAFIVNVVDASAQLATGCAIVGLGATAVNSLFVGTQLVILAYFIVGYVATKGLARQRLRWVFWAFVLSRIGVLLNLVNRLSQHPLHLSGIEWLTIVVFPLGCAYAILRHRLIDVNFVLNRTLIYTLLTTIVVGIFVLMEHVLNTIAVSRGVGLVLEVIVALGLGLSFNALHKRVEQMLERTLFRAKHEAAMRLQQLSEEAAFMENPDALIARAITEIPEALDARGAALYERRNGRYRLTRNDGMHELPDTVDTDDPAFVRLRKRLTQVDLADVHSSLGHDAIAFACAVRGQLVGAFICGRRKNGETYAPDEVATVRGVVHEIGTELNAIRARERAELLSGLLSGRIDLGTAREQGAQQE